MPVHLRDMLYFPDYVRMHLSSLFVQWFTCFSYCLQLTVNQFMITSAQGNEVMK